MAGGSTDYQVFVYKHLQDQHVPAHKITFPEGSPLHEGAARREEVKMELVLSIRNLTPAEEKAKLRLGV